MNTLVNPRPLDLASSRVNASASDSQQSSGLLARLAPGLETLLGRRQFWTALTSAVLCLCVAVAYLILERADLRRSALAGVDLHARVIENHANGLFNSLAQAMLRTQEALGQAGPEPSTPEVVRKLEQVRRGLPMLHSLTVLDGQGRLIVSTEPKLAPSITDAVRSHPSPLQSQVSIGPPLRLESESQRASTSAGRPALQLPSLLLQLPRHSAEPWLLVALIEPQVWVAAQESIVGPLAERAALINLEGRVLLHGRGIPESVVQAETVRKLLPFTEFFPTRASNAYIGKGLSEPRALVSFRTLNDWPAIIALEVGGQDLDRQLLRSVARSGLLLLSAWAVIGAFAAFAIRSARREERETANLESLNRQIAENEERWKLALEGAGDGVWDWDLSSDKLVVSARTLAMLGYGPHGVGETSQAWANLFHPEDRLLLELAVSEHLSGRDDILRVEIRIALANGDWGWFQLRGNRVEDAAAAGRHRRVAGTITDVTERRRAVTALLESEARAHDTFERAAVGMLHQNLDGRIDRVNCKLYEFLGMRRDQLMATRLEDLCFPGDQLLTCEETQRLAAGEVDSLVHEGRLRHSHGHYLWVRMTSSLAHSSTHSEPYLICVIEDVHQRTIFEKERHELLLRYRDTANELSRHRLALDKHTMVCMLDSEGVVKYVNSRLLEVSGFEFSELLGAVRAFPAPGAGASCWLDRNPNQVLSELRQAVVAGKVWQGELLHSKKNGDPYWAATTVVPILGVDGRLQEVFVLQTDITRRVHAESSAAEARSVELRIGANIQRSLLATVLDQRLPRTWLSAFTRPSQVIDGDFMHVITVGNDCVDVVAADVMGKGIGAALIGASAKMQLGQTMAALMADAPERGRPEPAQLVQALHKAMVPTLRDLEAFITVCYLRINSTTNTITWVGCGHEEPLLVRADGSTQVLTNHHPPMGVLDEVDYEQETTAMLEGDALFSCSDGLSDALRPDGTRVGRAAIEAAVRRRLGHCKAPGAIVHATYHELVGPGVQAVDDTSLLLAVRTSDTPFASRRELPYSLEALEHVRGVVSHRCSLVGLADEPAALFTLACVEAYTNIVRHNTGKVGDSKVELFVMLQPDQISAEFVYLADPVVLPETGMPDLGEYPEGGFGLNIMRSATDGLFHEHHDGVNTTRLIKNL